MKTLYLDCGMGAAGDMLAAALLELVPDREGFAERFRAAGIPDVQLAVEKAQKCGIVGTHVKMLVHGEAEVSEDAHAHEHHHEHAHEHEHEHHHEHHHEHAHQHHHASMQEIEEIIDGLHLEPQVRGDVLSIYHLIAEAESAVHGTDVADIHFHEVGTLDAIADITAVCMLMRELSPDAVVASPVAMGFGAVRCAHGVLPVPAPATAILLQGIPAYAGQIEGELCTPTGAALLKYFVSDYGQMPQLVTEKIGYGMGKKDFPRANCVRALIGETEDPVDAVVEISCNVDDMTGEEIGFAMERLFEKGALEVYTVPVYMKKNRPGTLLCVLVTREQKAEMVKNIFRYTSTIGVREKLMERHVLQRDIVQTDTAYGPVRRKVVSGYGVQRSKLEYEDVAQIAVKQDCSLREAGERAGLTGKDSVDQ